MCFARAASFFFWSDVSVDFFFLSASGDVTKNSGSLAASFLLLLFFASLLPALSSPLFFESLSLASPSAVGFFLPLSGLAMTAPPSAAAVSDFADLDDF